MKDAFSKDGGSPAETPWHQDESYWPDLPDKRALSFWSERNEFPHVHHLSYNGRFPMEDASVENGCMWFVPGSHKRGLLPHRPVIFIFIFLWNKHHKAWTRDNTEYNPYQDKSMFSQHFRKLHVWICLTSLDKQPISALYTYIFENNCIHAIFV